MPKTKPRKPAAKRSRGGKPVRVRRRAVSPRAVAATLAELAHDIRTALTGILSLSELLATSGLDERERGWAVSIKSTADHLAMLTSLIVDAARADARNLVLRRDLIRPRRFAETLAASLAARAEAKGLTAEKAIADDLPEAVIGDALRLRAALENLIDNAVKFTEQGVVALAVAAEPAGHHRVRLHFTIADSGIGLSAAEIKRLFRPFAQANRGIARRYGGAGLGLALARRIARAMKGDLTVASQPGGGCRFRFSVIVDQVAAAPASGEDAGVPPGRSGAPPLNILCAEDNPYGRVVLNTILTELGHRADFVASGEAAVDAVARGRYDAILMDVILPGIDGLEATRRIRALAAPAGLTPIVGISGRANAADEAAALAAGMTGYLAKPLSPSALARGLALAVSRAG